MSQLKSDEQWRQCLWSPHAPKMIIPYFMTEAGKKEKEHERERGYERIPSQAEMEHWRRGNLANG